MSHSSFTPRYSYTGIFKVPTTPTMFKENLSLSQTLCSARPSWRWRYVTCTVRHRGQTKLSCLQLHWNSLLSIFTWAVSQQLRVQWPETAFTLCRRPHRETAPVSVRAGHQCVDRFCVIIDRMVWWLGPHSDSFTSGLIHIECWCTYVETCWFLKPDVPSKLHFSIEFHIQCADMDQHLITPLHTHSTLTAQCRVPHDC